MKITLIAEFEGDITLTYQNGIYVCESKNGLIETGASGNEAFFNLGRAYRNMELTKNMRNKK